MSLGANIPLKVNYQQHEYFVSITRCPKPYFNFRCLEHKFLKRKAKKREKIKLYNIGLRDSTNSTTTYALSQKKKNYHLCLIRVQNGVDVTTTVVHRFWSTRWRSFKWGPTCRGHYAQPVNKIIWLLVIDNKHHENGRLWIVYLLCPRIQAFHRFIRTQNQSCGIARFNLLSSLFIITNII